MTEQIISERPLDFQREGAWTEYFCQSLSGTTFFNLSWAGKFIFQSIMGLNIHFFVQYKFGSIFCVHVSVCQHRRMYIMRAEPEGVTFLCIIEQNAVYCANWAALWLFMSMKSDEIFLSTKIAQITIVAQRITRCHIFPCMISLVFTFPSIRHISAIVKYTFLS